jgi:hypothetical protein
LGGGLGWGGLGSGIDAIRSRKVFCENLNHLNHVLFCKHHTLFL